MTLTAVGMDMQCVKPTAPAATVKWMCHGDHCTVNGGLTSGIFRSKSIFANSICVYLCRVCQCMSCISPYIIVYLDNYIYI